MEFKYQNALVVDDSLTLRSILISHLKDCGLVKYKEASNGAQAIEILKKDPNGYFDVIFTDWKMPQLDGIELIKYVRSDKSRPQPTIVIVTSEGEKDSVLKAMSVGADFFILKPFTAESVKEALRNLATKS